MREIKFRVLGQSKRMIPWGDLCGLHASTIFQRADSYHVMQFTGLKDKHGKEIYEGDLFAAQNGNWEIKLGAWTYWNGKREPFSLIPMCGFYAERNENGTKNQRPLFSDQIEVIGNIYENPDFLPKI